MPVDPAVVSCPMIATIVDGTGLIIYFMIARMTLPELAGFSYEDTVEAMRISPSQSRTSCFTHLLDR